MNNMSQNFILLRPSIVPAFTYYMPLSRPICGCSIVFVCDNFIVCCRKTAINVGKNELNKQ